MSDTAAAPVATQLWIELTDESGEETSIRWADVTQEQTDRILSFAGEVIGREPDTIG